MPRTMSAEEYQELGKRYYKQKEYQKAVDAFTEAIESMTIPTTSALNNRAASFEKLEDYKKAVKDARDMIKIDKKDLAGYLRAGQVLQKMEKFEAAIGIYQYGIKNVPVTDPNFKLIQAMHDKLTRKLSPESAVDPFKILPVEIVEMILSYLSFRNMVNCIRVSKQWKTFLINRPKLWLDLDLSHSRKPVSPIFVRHAVLRSQHKLHRATIHRFSKADMLRSLCTTCKVLEELEFLSGNIYGDPLIEMAQCSKSLRKLVIRLDISLDAVTQIIKYSNTLAHAEFTNVTSATYTAEWRTPMPHLKTLILTEGQSNVFTTQRLHLRSLIPQIPNLETLTTQLGARRIGDGLGLNGDYNFSSLTKLRELTLLRSDLPIFPQLPPSLTHLTLSLFRHNRIDYGMNPLDQGWMGSVRLSGLHALTDVLPNLVHLDLSHFNGISPEWLDILLSKRPKDGIEITNSALVDENHWERIPADELTPLQHLGVSDCSFANHDTLLNILSHPRLTHLTSLSLPSTTPPLTDDFIDALPTLLPHLTQLNLSKTSITGASIKTLCTTLSTTLKVLNVDFCGGISSGDAVRWARERGVSVSWRMGVEGGGKRVRW